MRYFFHVQTQEKMLLDDFGTDLADDAAALTETRAVYRELWDQFTPPKRRIKFERVCVTDDCGVELFREPAGV
jgi:Domain of unknown function (DUF6894)